MYRSIAQAALAGFLIIVPIVSIAQDQLPPEATIVTVSSGMEGGGYWNAAGRLQVVAGEMGLEIENLASSGSLENLERLMAADSTVNMAFAQADALQYYLDRRPREEKKFDILENIGQECVFIVTASKSKIRRDRDLHRTKDVRLGIASISSGVAVTFDYMTSQLPQLADTRVVYGDTVAAMDQLGKPGASVDAVMVVHRPRERSTEVEKALENPGRFRFVELTDKRLIAELDNGRSVYRGMKLAMPGGASPVETICVQGLLLLNKDKLADAQRDTLTDLVSYHWMRVYATP